MSEKEKLINHLYNKYYHDFNYKTNKLHFNMMANGLIQFGRDNPETCEIIIVGVYKICSNCHHKIANHGLNLERNGIFFCENCGRKCESI
jgi:hypothetical protein